MKTPQFTIRKSSGFKGKSTLKVNAQAVLKKNYMTRNVIAYIKGSLQPDSFIVFTAHYDHLGQMGDGIYFPGANDNASGTSMLLNLADYFTANPPGYSIAFICFSGEELGLLGSGYYVEHPLFPLGTIKFLVNLDIVGTGEDGIKVVNATEFPKQFDELLEINADKKYMKLISPRGKAANSDHYPFYLRDIPCFFIYTMGGISAYHDVNDRAETLPLTKYEELFKLLIEFERRVEEMVK
jgi:Zn-dependent M28 family amino/carboxypeptidase